MPEAVGWVQCRFDSDGGNRTEAVHGVNQGVIAWAVAGRAFRFDSCRRNRTCDVGWALLLTASAVGQGRDRIFRELCKHRISFNNRARRSGTKDEPRSTCTHCRSGREAEPNPGAACQELQPDKRIAPPHADTRAEDGASEPKIKGGGPAHRQNFAAEDERVVGRARARALALHLRRGATHSAPAVAIGASPAREARHG